MALSLIKAVRAALSDWIAEAPVGQSTITLTSEQDGVTIVAVANVTVTVENMDAVAVDDSAVTQPNTPVEIDVLANDSDPLGRALKIITVQSPTPQGGVVEIIADGTRLRYTPPADKAAISDTFSYTVEPVN